MLADRIYLPGESIGPYEVIRPLALGATSVVYEARPQAPYRADLLRLGISRVVVKVARLEPHAEDRHAQKRRVDRLDREFQTLFELTRKDHPHLVHVYDFGREQGVPYYVMEFVEGITLWQALEERPRLGQALGVFARLCGAVSMLHHGGICHRDLKPSNILVRVDGGEPVLIDFGLCLPPAVRTLTGPHELLGTPWYLSPEYATHWLEPEQVRAYVPMATDDVWALGIILYEVLTGGVPWVSPPERPEVLLKEIRDVVPPHPSDVWSRVPRAVGDVVMRMLEKNPRKRLQNADEVLKAIGHAAEGTDVLSPIAPRRRPGWARRKAKKLRSGQERGHVFQGAMVMTAALCVMGCAGYFMGARAQTQAFAESAARPGGGVSAKAGHGGRVEPLHVLEPFEPLREKFLPELSSAISGEEPSRFFVPPRPLEGQKVGPCNEAQFEEEINGGCWVWTGRVFHCKEVFEHKETGRCYRPVSKTLKPPSRSEDREAR